MGVYHHGSSWRLAVTLLVGAVTPGSGWATQPLSLHLSPLTALGSPGLRS